ncbi:MAG: family 78 glycoside hydrolase catalytic domain [Clostridia bacterium]|nr:family 78 glycoside hydrolase catalytic domain [Clostridia bacterium]
MFSNAKWIRSPQSAEGCPVFTKTFAVTKQLQSATLAITARGVYEASLNSNRIGDFVLAPGWTNYEKRLQVQTYDVTELLKENNTLSIQLAKGWYGLYGSWFTPSYQRVFESREQAVLCELTLTFADGTQEIIGSDESFSTLTHGYRFCDIYDGMIFDATAPRTPLGQAVLAQNQDKSMLIPQQGETIGTQERLKPIGVITTPKGETVLDFGQNMTGTIAIDLTAKAGEVLSLSFAEILDADGNFYNLNYRAAKCQYEYTCNEGHQTFMPTLTFYGFRYVRIDAAPEGITPDCFTAVVMHSNLRQTGRIITTHPKLQQLFQNVLWGQKSNYLDVPTDCPQRDERLGWTGDAQVFIKAAAYNYDVYRFFTKWLADLQSEQMANGAIPPVIPAMVDCMISAAWADAVTICPWQLYQTYGKTEILAQTFDAMKRWVDYITNTTTTKGLWTGGGHYGDWLELTAPFGVCKGQTRDDLIATAFYAHSAELIGMVGDVLGQDVTQYKALYETVKQTFIQTFEGTYATQTEMVLALQFNLTPNPEEVAAALAQRIHDDGDKIQTGFLGTPYILHVLTRYGYTDLAYTLLLREEYPSWLYPVTMGATTIWEHWDGITPEGKLWPETMNSYNHYAYGAVADWLYEVAAGITPARAGFSKIHFAPHPTSKIDSLGAEFETPHGLARSFWRHNTEGKVIYEITTPVPATAEIDGKTYDLQPGSYRF